jgi:hypothetical protein
MTVGRPFDKLDLHDQLRLDPDAAYGSILIFSHLGFRGQIFELLKILPVLASNKSVTLI